MYSSILNLDIEERSEFNLFSFIFDVPKKGISNQTHLKFTMSTSLHNKRETS